MYKIKNWLFFMFFIFPLIFSCKTTSSMSFNLESLSAGKDAKSYIYKIESGDNSISNDDLMFVKLKNILNESLVKNGFYVTDSEEEANAIIEFTAKISDPIKNTETTSITVAGENKVRTYQLNDTYRKTVILNVKEFNPQTKQKGSALWKMTVSSEDIHENMQYCLNKFVLGMEKYYGQDTNGRKTALVEVEFDISGNELKEIKTEVRVN